MATENIREKLAKLTSSEPSKWMGDAKRRKENKAWLKRSQAIALMVLRTLREKQMQQKDLARALGVSDQQISKIVKGKENLTLETVSKLEQALGVALMEVPSGEQPMSLPVSKSRYKLEYKSVKSYYYFEFKQSDYHAEVDQITKYLDTKIKHARIASILRATDVITPQSKTVYSSEENHYYKEIA